MFNLGFDRRVMMIIIIGFAAFNILTRPNGLQNAILAVPALLIAITFHEFAHAYSAHKLGDDTPKNQGRVTLNPLKHLDPIGTVLILTAGFGWGKPVQIDPRNFNKEGSMSKSEAIVAFAGPLMNFVLAFLFLILIYVLMVSNIISIVDLFLGTAAEWQRILYLVLLNCVFINIGLGIFNMLPMPPLDGSKILTHFLPYNGKMWFRNNEQIFFMVFLVLWMTGIAGQIISPLITGIYTGMNWVVGSAFELFM